MAALYQVSYGPVIAAQPVRDANRSAPRPLLVASRDLLILTFIDIHGTVYTSTIIDIGIDIGASTWPRSS
jgi:hypothetical protein